MIEIGSGVTWEGLRLLPGSMETVPLWIWHTEMERHTIPRTAHTSFHALELDENNGKETIKIVCLEMRVIENNQINYLRDQDFMAPED